MLLVKQIQTKNKSITLYKTQDNKYQIKYSLNNVEAESEEINNIEIALTLFTIKLGELDAALSTVPAAH